MWDITQPKVAVQPATHTEHICHCLRGLGVHRPPSTPPPRPLKVEPSQLPGDEPPPPLSSGSPVPWQLSLILKCNPDMSLPLDPAWAEA